MMRNCIVRNENRIIKVGSRDSKLAIIQTKLVIDEIKKYNPDMEFELVTMKTTGDKILDKTLDKIGGKGLFVKELDDALINKKVDITVHSLKDMPIEVNEELPLLAFLKRGNPMDVLVMPRGKQIEDLGEKPVIGSSSARRNIQLRNIFKEYVPKNIRGNVITRLEKLDRGEYDALILAGAGLERLNLESRISKIFSTLEMIPACGQGILVVQGRKGEDYSFLEHVNHEKTQMEAMAERAFVRQLDGGCSSPIGAYAQICEKDIIISGVYADEKKRVFITGNIRGKFSEGENLGRELAIKLKNSAE